MNFPHPYIIPTGAYISSSKHSTYIGWVLGIQQWSQHVLMYLTFDLMNTLVPIMNLSHVMQWQETWLVQKVLAFSGLLVCYLAVESISFSSLLYNCNSFESVCWVSSSYLVILSFIANDNKLLCLLFTRNWTLYNIYEYLLWMSSFTLHNCHRRWILLLFLCYRWGSWGTDRSINLLEVSYLVRARTGVQTQTVEFWRLCSSLLSVVFIFTCIFMYFVHVVLLI